MRSWLIAALIVVIPGTTLAQDGLRSAVLPERTPTSPAPQTPRDLYRVPPDFYNRLNPWRPPVVTSGGYWQPAHTRPRPTSTRDWSREEAAVARDSSDSSVTGDPKPASAVPMAQPGPPKTFYLIPGCYAGDRPPEPGRLAAGCRSSLLRMIPPS